MSTVSDGWIPPFFACGVCGGEIGRRPITDPTSVEKAVQVDLGRMTYAWKHRTVPEAYRDFPHQAVLGTPAHTPHFTEPKKSKGEPTAPPEPPPAPEVPARLALAHEIPESAARFGLKATAEGWKVRTYYMRGPRMDAQWRFSQMVESVVVKALRDGHLLVGVWTCRVPGAISWTAKDWPGPPYAKSWNPWKFDEAYSVGHVVEPLTSTELNAALVIPRAICEDCGEPPALHWKSPTGPVCWSEFTAQQKEA